MRSPVETIRADAATALGLLLMGVLLLLVGSGLAGQLRDAVSRNHELSVEQLLGAGAAASGAVLLLWWFVSIAGAAAGFLLERQGQARAAATARTLSPAFMQRLVLAAVSFQLLSGAAAHAAAPAPGPAWTPTHEQETAGPASLVPVVPGRYGPDPVPGAEAGKERQVADGTSGDAYPPADGSTHPGTVPAAPQPGPAASSDGTAGVPVPAETVAPSAFRSSISPGWKPSAPAIDPGLLAAPAARTVAASVQGSGPQGSPVAVLAGDNLWNIVSSYLGPQSSDVDIALEWPRWYEANRSVIGPDPNTLLPGQVLLPPAAE